jgi:3',5'-cyclic-nucleotide phosphodiesterase
MEIELGIPTQLFGGPPVRDNVVKMGESQIGFINVFARPLFENVAKLLPGMQFAVDTIIENERVWQVKIREEKEVQERGIVRNETTTSGMLSPRSGSPARGATVPKHDAAPSALAMQPDGSSRPFTSNGHPLGPTSSYEGQRAEHPAKPASKEKLYKGSSSTTDVGSASAGLNSHAKKGGTWKKIFRKFKG